MGSAVEDVHHRDGQRFGVCAADVAIERHFLERRGRTRDWQARRQEWRWRRVSIYSRAVEIDHRLVDQRLVERVQSLELAADRLVDILDGRQNAFAA